MCKNLLRWVILTLVATNATVLNAETKDDPQGRTIMGWVEWAQLQPSGKYAKVKLDTGAKTSSMHAKNIEWFERDGREWVRFQFSSNTKLSSKLLLEGKTKNVLTIETPVVRNTLIKQHKRASAERPVIRQKFILNGKEYEGEFTLSDRSRFIYPILLGRRFLQNVAVVDPGHTFLLGRPQLKKKTASTPPSEPAKPAAVTEAKVPTPAAKPAAATPAPTSETSKQ